MPTDAEKIAMGTGAAGAGVAVGLMTDMRFRDVICPNFRTALPEFNALLTRLGGKAMEAGDVAGRGAYTDGLTPEQLSAYHQAHFYWSEQGGDPTSALHHADAVERVRGLLSRSAPESSPAEKDWSHLPAQYRTPSTKSGAQWGRGYVGYSMSVNAAEARGRGEMTSAELAKALNKDVPEFKGLTAADVKEIVPYAEHHTSKFYNLTAFHDPGDVVDYADKLEQRAKDRIEWKALNKESDALGIKMILTPDGRKWYPHLPDDNLTDTHLERLRDTVRQTRATMGVTETPGTPGQGTRSLKKSAPGETSPGESDTQSAPQRGVSVSPPSEPTPAVKPGETGTTHPETANAGATGFEDMTDSELPIRAGTLRANAEDTAHTGPEWEKAKADQRRKLAAIREEMRRRGISEPVSPFKTDVAEGGSRSHEWMVVLDPTRQSVDARRAFLGLGEPAPLSQEGKPLKAPEKGTTAAGEGNAETERFAVDAPRRPMKTQRMEAPEAETAHPEAPTPTQKAASAAAAPALKPTGLKGIGRALVQAFSPASMSKGAGYAARSIREHASEMMRDYDRADNATKSFSKALLRMPVEERWEFIDRVENGQPQPTPELQKMADGYRAMLDQARTDIQDLGEGALDQFYADYFPHIWKDPGLAAGTFGKRPLEGSKSFLKKRTLPTIAEGRSAGLEPLTDNPNDLFLIKLREMYRYRAARRIIQDLKDHGQISYIDARARTPEGQGKIDDRFATVYGSGKIEVKEGYDQQMVESLRKILGSIGVSSERIARFKGEPDTWGQTSADGIKTRFGGPEMVLTHEIGHAIDSKYGLGKHLFGVDVKDAVLPELQHLAEQRWGKTEPSGGFKRYVMKRTELVANLIHAYVHNPDMARQMAPTAVQVLDGFIDAHPELRGLRDVRPGLELGVGSEEFGIGGLEIKGRYVAPVDVARVLNNHLSPGLAGNPIYSGIRAVQNTMQMAQLGLSAFHGLMTSIGAAVNIHAEGLEALARGDILAGLKNIGKAATIGEPVIEQYIKGNKMLQEWYGTPQGAEIAKIVDGLVSGGGRARMDPFYETFGVGADTVQKAFAEGRYVKGALMVPGAGIRLAARPIMQALVPRLKMGAFFDLYGPELERLGPDATHEELQAAATKVWDSVDNRLGQLVYDNLFWPKAQKDIAMLSVRSLGWNLGTIRELGGAAVDVATLKSRIGAGDPWMSHRMAYAASLPIVAGYMGAIYMAARGLKPESLRDYFQPRTGRKNKDGSDERVVLPTYMKDVASYSSHPLKTLRNKLAPEWELFSEVANNETFYGDAIRDERDPFYIQALDVSKHMAGAFVPFSLETDRLGPDATPERRLEQFVGLTKVPKDYTQAEQFKREGGIALAEARKLRVDTHAPIQNALKEWGITYASPEPDWSRNENDDEYAKRKVFVDRYVAERLPGQIADLVAWAKKQTDDASRTVTDLDVKELMSQLMKEADSEWWGGQKAERKPKVSKRY